MKCVATIKGGTLVSVNKYPNGVSANGNCMEMKSVYNEKTLKDDLVPTLKEGLKDGEYFCPKSVWKEKVRDFGKVKTEVKATKAKTKKETK